MRPTMTDVAKKAGVSIGTVSLVLNEKPGISAEVRTQVLQTAEELGYRLPQRRVSTPALTSVTVVHYANRAYRNGAPKTTGVLVNYVNSIQEALQEHGCNWTLLSEYEEGDSANLGFQLLDNRQLAADGLILIGVPNRESSLLKRAMAENIPVIALSRDWPDLPVSTVSQDNGEATNIAMAHLIELSHTKIGFVASVDEQKYNWFAPRLRTYRQAMTDNGHDDDDLVALGRDVRAAVHDLMTRRPDVTAIFAVHDEAAIAAMIALDELGLRISQDVSVIGLDDSAIPPEHLPSLTTVGFPHRKVGRLAAELLLQQISDESLFYSKIFVRSHLVARESCAGPRS